MFNVHLLEAKTGDSFIVECGEQAFIIDGGTKSVGKKLKNYFKNSPQGKIKAIFVTHVDSDHVGGILKLFSEFSHYVCKDIKIYMNHPDLVYSLNTDDDLVSYAEGDTLKSILTAQGYEIYNLIADQNIIFDDVKFEVINPSQDLANRLYTDWTGKSKQHSESDDMVSNDPIIVDYLLDCNEYYKSIDSDIVNAASLSFCIKYNDKKALFLSDSHPSIISNKLSQDDKYHIVKVSHHGSKYNTTKELLNKIKCDRFIISTNGPISYSHPDSSCIANIIRSCVINGITECTFYFNYKKVAERIVLKNLPDGIKINIESSNLVEI